MVESPWKYGLDARFLPFRDKDAIAVPSPVETLHSELDELEAWIAKLIEDITDLQGVKFYRAAVKDAITEATSLREREKAFFDQETAAMKPFRSSKTLRSKLKKKPARPARKSTTPSPRSHACSRRSPRRGPCHACSKPNQFPRLLSLFQ